MRLQNVAGQQPPFLRRYRGVADPAAFAAPTPTFGGAANGTDSKRASTLSRQDSD